MGIVVGGVALLAVVALISLKAQTTQMPSSLATEMEIEQEGSNVLVLMKTTDAYPSVLCDVVMEDIYMLAAKYPSASAIHFTVRVPGKDDAVIAIDDLDTVRKFSNKKEYASSEHRTFVGGSLVAVGLIEQSSLAAAASTDYGTGLIGRKFESGPEVSPRLGVRFLDDTQVDILADGVKVGATCNYTVSGSSITIPTSCSISHFRIEDDHLVNEDLHCALSKQ